MQQLSGGVRTLLATWILFFYFKQKISQQFIFSQQFTQFMVYLLHLSQWDNTDIALAPQAIILYT